MRNRKSGAKIASAILILCSLPFWYPPPAQCQHFLNELYGRRTNVQCAAFSSRTLGRTIRYSIYLPPGYFKNPDRCYPVLYYIHGFDHRGKAFFDWVNWHLDETLDRLIEDNAVEEMVVVIPESFVTGVVVDWGKPPERCIPASVLTFPFRATRGFTRTLADTTYFGSHLFVHRRNLKPADYAAFLTTEFFDHIQNNYRIDVGRPGRAITGFSTGGYSSLSIAFQHPELFDSVSAHSPMLVPVSPFSQRASEFFIQYDPGREKPAPHNFFIHLLRRMFQNEKTWDEHDPFSLSRRRPLEDLPVYIDVALRDKRGYDVGARVLVAILLERNVPVEFHLLKGLPPQSNHTYPGFLNGRLIASLAEGKTDEELDRYFGWEGVRPLINPHAQQIECSLMFHSREFSR